MNPGDYDAWYDTPRGRWIGETEHELLLRLLEPRSGDRVVDVGCGTGWFTRRLAALPGLHVTGVDVDAEWLAFARSRDARSAYLQADARALPFADGSVDRTVSVAALCFVADWHRALKEIARVTRSRFVVGVLNRRSLLWRAKGRDGGSGAYRGAYWHTTSELREAIAGLPVHDVRFRSAVFLPSGSPVARIADRMLPSWLIWGGFTVVSATMASGRAR